MKRREVLSVALGTLFAAAGVWAVAAPHTQVRRIVARKFTYLPNVVKLKKGVPAVLEFTSADVVMGFNCPDFKIRTDIIPGQVARVRFTPDRIGTFVYLCDVFCGDGHEGMTGKIQVVA
ncbi:MAG TPA: cupredoxin domain-containing protein [Burkholderiales bacterium]|nr:cupredoxin domain-containing protein [Burkholderiales bacterium]